MGKAPKPPKNQTTTSVSEPWKGVQPYLTDYLKMGQQATRRPYQFYNGSTIAGFAPEQQAGMNLATQRAMAGSPTQNAANRQVTSTLRGDYLNPETNPYLKGTVNRALDDVQTRVNSQFNNSNFGSSANQETLSRNLGEQANAIYGQNYSNERNNQMQAVGQAIPLANADYNDANMLQSIGAQRQGLANQYLAENKAQFDAAANHPYEQLQRYGNVVSQGTGQGGTVANTGPGQAQPQSNRFAGALGGAATGAKLGSIFPGVGTAVGAGVGALGGLLLG